MKNRFILFLLAFAGLTGCVEPEIEMFGSISGVVKDSQTNKVLEGVKVTMSPGGNSQLTGQDGTFSFEELDQSEYTLSFVKEGYEDESQKVSVKPGLSASVQVSMMPIVPELDLSTTALSFGEELSTLSIDISNSGKGELKWKVTEDIDWLEASVSEGVTTTEKASVVFNVSRAELEEGNYMDSFVISSNGGSETVMVMLTVATLQFSVTPAEVDFSTVTNTVQLTLTNLGKKSLEWSAKTSKEWLTLSKTSGMITGEDYVNAIASREGLSAGHYTADIIFVSDGGEISVPVLMEVAVDEKPTVTVESISGVSYNGAVLHGTMVSVGSDKVTRHGFCWSSTNETPTIDDEFSNLGDCTTPEAFESVISNLSADTKYYVRAYAENSVGISYSEKAQTFTTTGLPTLPGVTTGTIDEITSSSAKAKGKITSLGNVTSVSAYGHVWSTEPEPTLENSKSTNLGEAKSAESFVSNLTGLDVATNYYVRAYATNEKGTSYGEIATFVTLKTEAVIETSDVVDIVHNAATAGGKITSSGGHKINERGVCWSVDPMPNMEDNIMQSESSDDTWTCRLTGLEMENTYYVRAYVKTSDGTVFYGADKKFTTTKEVKLATVSEVTVSNVTTNSASVVSKILFNGNSDITDCGFCWSEKKDPTTEDSKMSCDVNSADMGATISDLEDGKTYYVRAFAINAMGIVYSESVEFTTLAITSPVLSTVYVTNVTTSTATFSAEVISSGNSEIVECGFCWSDSVTLPTVNDNKCETSLTEFGTNLTGLTDGKTYYVRAYARNSKGTGYSDVAEFITTKIEVPTISSVLVENVGRTSAQVSASVSDTGNADVTDYGFCWSANPEPKIHDNKVSCFTSSSELSFSTKLKSLPELSTVYVRAYAVNSKGTNYSNETSFTTEEVDIDVWDGSTVAAKFSSGMGSESDPIIISTADQFALFAKNISQGTQYSGIYFKLESNIGLNSYAWPYKGGKFSGILDADNKYIEGFNGTASLFHTNAGTIKNLTLKGKINASDSAGGICTNNEGTIDNCSVGVMISATSSYVGGICGKTSYNSVIKNSCNVGEITSSSDYVGGIVGNCGGTVDGCSNKGKIKGNSCVGGISGIISRQNLSDTPIKNSYNEAEITATNGIAGGVIGKMEIIGTTEMINVSIINCYNVAPVTATTAGGLCGNLSSTYNYDNYYGRIRGSANAYFNNCITNSAEFFLGNYVEIAYDDYSNNYNEWSGGYWLNDIVSNVGHESGAANQTVIDRWFNRDAKGCYVKGTDDLLTILNNFVNSNSGLKKWKYETVDGYACPVFDE